MPVDEPLYPVNLRLRGRSVLMVGGGPVALSKVEGLLEGGADSITVVAPDVLGEFDDLDVEVERRAYRAGEAADHRYVVTAVDDRDVTAQVWADAEAAGVWVNAADDPEFCSVTLPSRVRRGPVLLTASTGGRSPALSAWLRSWMEREFGSEVEVLLDLLSEARERIRAEGRSTEGLDWQKALDSGMLEMVRQGRIVEAESVLWSCLSSS